MGEENWVTNANNSKRSVGSLWVAFHRDAAAAHKLCMVMWKNDGGRRRVKGRAALTS